MGRRGGEVVNAEIEARWADDVAPAMIEIDHELTEFEQQAEQLWRP